MLTPQVCDSVAQFCDLYSGIGRWHLSPGMHMNTYTGWCWKVVKDGVL